MADKKLARLVKQADRQLGLFSAAGTGARIALPPAPDPDSLARLRAAHDDLEAARTHARENRGATAAFDLRMCDAKIDQLNLKRATLPAEARHRLYTQRVEVGALVERALARMAAPAPAPVAAPALLSRPAATSRNLKAVSMSRYNGGVKAKRQYGSATITEFAVWDERFPRVSVRVRVGGATPGERTTIAKQQAAPLLDAELRKQGLL